MAESALAAITKLGEVEECVHSREVGLGAVRKYAHLPGVGFGIVGKYVHLPEVCSDVVGTCALAPDASFGVVAESAQAIRQSPTLKRGIKGDLETKSVKIPPSLRKGGILIQNSRYCK